MGASKNYEYFLGSVPVIRTTILGGGVYFEVSLSRENTKITGADKQQSPLILLARTGRLDLSMEYIGVM